ncbi:SDR family oxidoreductase [Jatrophihabitans telluris]|uniref:SDR family oxidoreductase n=1 Tax=Jatrophihabitans telluris TaxID=2038343 RepID=A0ABY4R3F8_9ACTN|nr:SDR family oxidoreductase [Jatrophihabitans telluris]UQX89781.1 SDR family oxidoreductase [Jatrophihabitans telluris]
MTFNGSVALVTGANRGLGREFVRALQRRGVSRIYAGARNPDSVTVDNIDGVRVIPLRMDVTDPDTVAQAAAVATDVDLLINNAGSSTGSLVVTGDLSQVRLEMDTHYYGTLTVIRAFAPILDANGGGAIVNVLSALSWAVLPTTSAYSAAKSAEWALTNAVRQELAAQGTQVSALHVGYMDTDMTARIDAPKSHPAVIAEFALDAVEAGELEILADETSRTIKQALSAPIEAIYPQFSGARA